MSTSTFTKVERLDALAKSRKRYPEQEHGKNKFFRSLIKAWTVHSFREVA